KKKLIHPLYVNSGLNYSQTHTCAHMRTQEHGHAHMWEHIPRMHEHARAHVCTLTHTHNSVCGAV
uniref:Uncharacterized protein n=2 Tax=Ursus TaxID=9639 RepID=A0A452UXQ4_URSMA